MNDKSMERRMQQELRHRIDKKIENLRDQFAMAALTGLTARYGLKWTGGLTAETAYEFADAMMEARKGENSR